MVSPMVCWEMRLVFDLGGQPGVGGGSIAELEISKLVE